MDGYVSAVSTDGRILISNIWYPVQDKVFRFIPNLKSIENKKIHYGVDKQTSEINYIKLSSQIPTPVGVNKSGNIPTNVIKNSRIDDIILIECFKIALNKSNTYDLVEDKTKKLYHLYSKIKDGL